MMSPIDTLLVEEEGADVVQADQDGAGPEGAAESIYRDLNCTLLRLTVAFYGTNMSEVVRHRKRDGKTV